MGYLVLARKYRPQVFDEVVGQEHIVTTLKNAIITGKIAHSYIFAGPRGVGKTTMARLLAKALNCEMGPTVTPCNTCSNCVEIAESRSVDVIEIDGASNRGIDEVRTIREDTRYVAQKSRYKIYIIDEIHMLTREAFNALLKTLEEPPSHTVFIFATTEPYKVPTTILSRCQRFDFHRLKTSEIYGQLARIVKQEGIDIEDGALWLIARKAEGGLRDAEGMLDQLATFVDGRITVADVAGLFGILDREVFKQLLTAIHTGDDKTILELVDSAVGKGYDVGELVKGFSEYIRLLLAVQIGAKLDILAGFSQEEMRDLQALAGEIDREYLFRVLSVLGRLEGRMRYSPSPRSTLEVELLRLARIKHIVSVEDLLSSMKAGKFSPPSTKMTTAKFAEIPDLSVEEVWPRLLKGVKERFNNSLYSFLVKMEPVKWDGRKLAIGTPEPNSFGAKRVIAARDEIAEVLHSITGKSVHIEIVGTRKSSPIRRSNEVDDPLIREAMEVFDGEVIIRRVKK